MLDTDTLTGFSGGQYLVWTLTGHVTIRTTATGGPNAVVSGWFFEPSSPAPVSVTEVSGTGNELVTAAP